jgi:hypothetical protein
VSGISAILVKVVFDPAWHIRLARVLLSKPGSFSAFETGVGGARVVRPVDEGDSRALGYD